MGRRLRWISQMISAMMPPRNRKGSRKIRKTQPSSSHGGDVAGYAGLRVAAQVSANRGQVARHLGAALDPGIAADGGDVSRDRGARFGKDASGDSR